MPTTNHQIMRARKLVELTLDELSAAAGVCKATLQRVENGARVQSPTLWVIRSALENAGAEFRDDGAVIDRRNPSRMSLRP